MRLSSALLRRKRPLSQPLLFLLLYAGFEVIRVRLSRKAEAFSRYLLTLSKVSKSKFAVFLRGEASALLWLLYPYISHINSSIRAGASYYAAECTLPVRQWHLLMVTGNPDRRCCSLSLHSARVLHCSEAGSMAYLTHKAHQRLHTGNHS